MTFEAGDRVYRWVGGFGAVFHSYERGVNVGDVRVVLGQLFYAYIVRRRGWFRAAEVSWTKQDIGPEDIRRFKRRAFGVECEPANTGEQP